jgi:hypothetical protein
LDGVVQQKIILHFRPGTNPDIRGEVVDPPFTALARSSAGHLLGNEVPRTSPELRNEFDEACVFEDGKWIASRRMAVAGCRRRRTVSHRKGPARQEMHQQIVEKV